MQLTIIQLRQMEAVAQFLRKLRDTPERGSALLDHAAVMFGSAMGNASSHNCKNLPIAVAGGGFRHGQHLVFDRVDNTPLSRLYVSLSQWMGVETDQFGTGNGRLPNFEFTS